MDCLRHLLQLWSENHRFKILYNHEHCIGVSESKLFDFGGFLRKDFLSGAKINYSPIEEWHDKETVKKIFSLKDKEYEILKEYYEKKSND